MHVIVDAVEADFRLESLPHTIGSARQEMVERKLNQLYRNTHYRAALYAGREADKRRDDRFLMMALTNPDIVAPWMNLLEGIQAPLAGVYLLPVISQLLVKKLKLKQSELLLMTHHCAGLRQTYFSGQQLRVSRLTPLTGIDSRQLGTFYVSEMEKTRLYLESLRIIGRETPLHVVFLALEAEDARLASSLASSHGSRCLILGPETLARHLGLKQEMLQHYPDLIHMQMLAWQRPACNLVSARQTRSYQLFKLRIGINFASALCVTGAIVLATFNLMQAAELGRKLATMTEQTHRQEALYNEVAQNFPKTPVSGNDLKLAVELAQKIDGLNRTPLRLMQVTSAVLDAQREIRINRLRWHYGTDPQAMDESSSNPANVPLPSLPPQSPSGLYEIGFIDGEINDFKGDYRAALESVNRLAENLRRNPQVEQVVILQQPVNTSSLVKLQGTTLDQQAQQMPAAHFKLRLVLKSGDAS
ncbi:MAG: hypothetical protein N2Z69_00385 [Methylophilaceae bacterium]|nr:hypothetical protein [Methylophilaceae bacterium]